jgi:F-type H+-transporting ATPase subunit gamma
MDNASKNAGEMSQSDSSAHTPLNARAVGKLQMQFNRMRQTQITNDLVDIVTGASGSLFWRKWLTFARTGANAQEG